MSIETFYPLIMEHMTTLRLCLFITIAVVGSSCSKPSALVFSVPTTTFPVSEELKQSISYSEVNLNVFANKCLSCHDGDSKIPLDTYEAAFSNLKNIQKTVLSKRSMPRSPIKPLTQRELTLVAAWVEAGGPKEPLNGSGGPDEPGPVLEAKYESIKSLIIDRKCIACHSPGGGAAQIPLVTKDDLVNSSLEIVVPGNPDDSGLMIVLEEGARKFMPPKTSGFSPVSEAEKAVIREWILSGAP